MSLSPRIFLKRNFYFETEGVFDTHAFTYIPGANIGTKPPMRLFEVVCDDATGIGWSVDEMRGMTGDDGRMWMTRLFEVVCDDATGIGWSVDEMRGMTGDDGRTWMTRLFEVVCDDATGIGWSMDEMRGMTGDDGRTWMTMTVDGRDAPVHGDLRTVLAPAPNCMADARDNPRRPNDMQQKKGKKKEGIPSNARI